MNFPKNIGELMASGYRSRSVKDEIRANLLAKLRRRENLFAGIIGYDDTVVPQMVNALLSRHNLILLGLRGQAKSRIVRSLATLLDERLPVIRGCEINDNPLAPLCKSCRERVAEEGDAVEIDYVPRADRYVEKLATPDVTIADIIGDIDPIKAARRGLSLSDELTIHFGLLPRANRGIFALNELPDLAPKIQVGLFNIMEERDVQIRGYPVRLPLDIFLVFTANPEDYTARGKIITPLKDRIGSEIRTHYPASVEEGIDITAQEAWTHRAEVVMVPSLVREIVEEVAFRAREHAQVDKQSGVSQRMPITSLENVVSNAERRCAESGAARVVPGVADVYFAIPSITGKMELEYEGEAKGAEAIARELIRSAIVRVFQRYLQVEDCRAIVEWFDAGNVLDLPLEGAADGTSQAMRDVPELMEKARGFVKEAENAPEVRAVAAEFVLEGLAALKKIQRTELSTELHFASVKKVN